MICVKAARALKDRLPNVDVEVTTENGVLTVVVVGSAESTKTLFRRVWEALMDAGMRDDVLAVEFASYPSRSEWIQKQAEDLLRSAVSNGRTHVDLNFRHSNGVLNVEIVCENGPKETQDKVNAILPEVRRLAHPDRVFICYSNGLPPFPQYLPAAEDNDFDEQPENPNWPSKTGNPSGKGRGNNPPKFGR